MPCLQLEAGLERFEVSVSLPGGLLHLNSSFTARFRGGASTTIFLRCDFVGARIFETIWDSEPPTGREVEGDFALSDSISLDTGDLDADDAGFEGTDVLEDSNVVGAFRVAADDFAVLAGESFEGVATGETFDDTACEGFEGVKTEEALDGVAAGEGLADKAAFEATRQCLEGMVKGESFSKMAVGECFEVIPVSKGFVVTVLKGLEYGAGTGILVRCKIAATVATGFDPVTWQDFGFCADAGMGVAADALAPTAEVAKDLDAMEKELVSDTIDAGGDGLVDADGGDFEIGNGTLHLYAGADGEDMQEEASIRGGTAATA